MKRFVYASIALVLFCSCNTEKKESADSAIEKPQKEMNDVPYKKVAKSDDLLLKETVNSFLGWYKLHYNEIADINLIHKDGGQYRINEAEANKYIDLLKSSGYLSESFLKYLKNHIRECDQILIEEEQSEGEPMCLDYDLILRTQEIEESISRIGNHNFNKIEVRGDSAEVSVKLAYNLSLYLVKQGNRWEVTQTYADSNEY